MYESLAPIAVIAVAEWATWQTEVVTLGATVRARLTFLYQETEVCLQSCVNWIMKLGLKLVGVRVSFSAYY